jgi:hypothetical protein
VNLGIRAASRGEAAKGAGPRSIAAMAGGRRGVALLWLRRGDLRVADNEALTAAANSGAAHVLPVFCLDPAELRPRQPVGEGSALGVPQMGPHRLR